MRALVVVATISLVLSACAAQSQYERQGPSVDWGKVLGAIGRAAAAYKAAQPPPPPPPMIVCRNIGGGVTVCQ